MTNNKPREFWIDIEFGSMYFNEDDYEHDKMPTSEKVHVIEYSTYETLEKAYKHLERKWFNDESEQIDRLEAELEQNIKLHNIAVAITDEVVKERDELKLELERLIEENEMLDLCNDSRNKKYRDVLVQADKLAATLDFASEHIKSMDNYSLISRLILHIDDALEEFEAFKKESK